MVIADVLLLVIAALLGGILLELERQFQRLRPPKPQQGTDQWKMPIRVPPPIRPCTFHLHDPDEVHVAEINTHTREVPAEYEYGGRTYRLIGQQDDGPYKYIEATSGR